MSSTNVPHSLSALHGLKKRTVPSSPSAREPSSSSTFPLRRSSNGADRAAAAAAVAIPIGGATTLPSSCVGGMPTRDQAFRPLSPPVGAPSIKLSRSQRTERRRSRCLVALFVLLVVLRVCLLDAELLAGVGQRTYRDEHYFAQIEDSCTFYSLFSWWFPSTSSRDTTGEQAAAADTGEPFWVGGSSFQRTGAQGEYALDDYTYCVLNTVHRMGLRRLRKEAKTSSDPETAAAFRLIEDTLSDRRNATAALFHFIHRLVTDLSFYQFGLTLSSSAARAPGVPPTHKELETRSATAAAATQLAERLFRLYHVFDENVTTTSNNSVGGTPGVAPALTRPNVLEHPDFYHYNFQLMRGADFDREERELAAIQTHIGRKRDKTAATANHADGRVGGEPLRTPFPSLAESLKGPSVQFVFEEVGTVGDTTMTRSSTPTAPSQAVRLALAAMRASLHRLESQLNITTGNFTATPFFFPSEGDLDRYDRRMHAIQRGDLDASETRVSHGWRKFFIGLNLYKNEESIPFIASSLLSFLLMEVEPLLLTENARARRRGAAGEAVSEHTYTLENSVVLSVYANNERTQKNQSEDEEDTKQSADSGDDVLRGDSPTSFLIREFFVPQLKRFARLDYVFATTDGECLLRDGNYVKEETLERRRRHPSSTREVQSSSASYDRDADDDAMYTAERDATVREGKHFERIEWMACIRNKVLEPLFKFGAELYRGDVDRDDRGNGGADTVEQLRDEVVVLFLNDIFFTPTDAVALLESVPHPDLLAAGHKGGDGTGSVKSDGPLSPHQVLLPDGFQGFETVAYTPPSSPAASRRSGDTTSTPSADPSAFNRNSKGTVFDMACGVDYNVLFYDVLVSRVFNDNSRPDGGGGGNDAAAAGDLYDRFFARNTHGDVVYDLFPTVLTSEDAPSDGEESRASPSSARQRRRMQRVFHDIYATPTDVAGGPGNRHSVLVKSCWNGLALIRGSLFLGEDPDDDDEGGLDAKENKDASAFTGARRRLSGGLFVPVASSEQMCEAPAGSALAAIQDEMLLLYKKQLLHRLFSRLNAAASLPSLFPLLRSPPARTSGNVTAEFAAMPSSSSSSSSVVRALSRARDLLGVVSSRSTDSEGYYQDELLWLLQRYVFPNRKTGLDAPPAATPGDAATNTRTQARARVDLHYLLQLARDDSKLVEHFLPYLKSRHQDGLSQLLRPFSGLAPNERCAEMHQEGSRARSISKSGDHHPHTEETLYYPLKPSLRFRAPSAPSITYLARLYAGLSSKGGRRHCLSVSKSADCGEVSTISAAAAWEFNACWTSECLLLPQDIWQYLLLPHSTPRNARTAPAASRRRRRRRAALILMNPKVRLAYQFSDFLRINQFYDVTGNQADDPFRASLAAAAGAVSGGTARVYGLDGLSEADMSSVLTPATSAQHENWRERLVLRPFFQFIFASPHCYAFLRWLQSAEYRYLFRSRLTHAPYRFWNALYSWWCASHLRRLQERQSPSRGTPAELLPAAVTAKNDVVRSIDLKLPLWLAEDRFHHTGVAYGNNDNEHQRHYPYDRYRVRESSTASAVVLEEYYDFFPRVYDSASVSAGTGEAAANNAAVGQLVEQRIKVNPDDYTSMICDFYYRPSIGSKNQPFPLDDSFFVNRVSSTLATASYLADGADAATGEDETFYFFHTTYVPYRTLLRTVVAGAEYAAAGLVFYLAVWKPEVGAGLFARAREVVVTCAVSASALCQLGCSAFGVRRSSTRLRAPTGRLGLSDTLLPPAGLNSGGGGGVDPSRPLLPTFSAQGLAELQSRVTACGVRVRRAATHLWRICCLKLAALRIVRVFKSRGKHH